MFSRFEKGMYLRVDSVDNEAYAQSRQIKSLQVTVIQDVIFFSKKSKNDICYRDCQPLAMRIKVFHQSDYLCQRLSTQESYRKYLIRCDLSFVNTVNT